MEHFRSSGTSGGLLFSRTRSAYVKAAANDFLRAVGAADAGVIARGTLRPGDLERLKERAMRVVGESWLGANDALPAVVAFFAVRADAAPEQADRIVSNLLRARFPAETERPALNSRWG